jgi:hypothetical protein
MDFHDTGAMMVFQQTVLDTPSIAAAIGMWMMWPAGLIIALV